MGYAPPLFPFPFPDDLVCGEAYIKPPKGGELVVKGDIDTEVAIPESWVEVGVGEDGKTNRTKEGYSLVMPRKRTMGCDKTKFVPVYRNATFESSDDKFIKPEKYYLEYLGPPSAHIRTHTCNIPYHLLSRRGWEIMLGEYYMGKYESNDWLFQLFSGNTEKGFEMVPREPLAESEVFSVCHMDGRHAKYNPGKSRMYTCDFPPYFEQNPTPCFVTGPTSSAPANRPSHDRPTPLGLVIGLPIGVVVGVLLLGVGFYYLAPWVKRKMRREGAIQL